MVIRIEPRLDLIQPNGKDPAIIRFGQNRQYPENILINGGEQPLRLGQGVVALGAGGVEFVHQATLDVEGRERNLSPPKLLRIDSCLIIETSAKRLKITNSSERI